LIRVLVWAKSAIARAGLESIVQADARFELARAAIRSADLLTALHESAPDVVLVDLADNSITRLLPGFAGQPIAPAVVVLLDVLRRADVLRLLQAGVRAVMARESHSQEIAAALQAAHDGLAVFSPEILDVLLPTSTELAGAGDLPPGEPLTDRESAVLALMAEGAANKEIAARLNISEHTVKFHVSSILNKLGAATRTEAVSRGYKEGLILM
jgi:two-component system, NarL family, response regulator YdfI